ncbi:hypothetical protein [Glutamicibacter sp. V16R2B1]|nr:hypothetical protein [Glutamicibacter sp. V16R2B1]MCK9901311.1 hypothetical protein [Frankia sp. Cpl3]
MFVLIAALMLTAIGGSCWFIATVKQHDADTVARFNAKRGLDLDKDTP